MVRYVDILRDLDAMKIVPFIRKTLENTTYNLTRI